MSTPPATPVEPVAPVDVLDSAEAGGRAIRGSAWRTGAYGVSLLLSLVSVPFVIRHLGVVDYGYYLTVSSIVFIIGGVTEAGLTNLGIREVSVLDGAARDAFLRNLVGLRFVLTTVGVLLATLLVWATGAEHQVVIGTLIAGLALLISLTQSTYMVPLNAQLRLGWVSVLDVLRQATLSSLFIVFVIAGAGLVAFFWAGVISAVVMIAATLLLVRRHASLRPAFDLATWKRVLRETLPYAAAAAVGLVYFRIAVILMSYVASKHETGIFSAAFRIVEVVGAIPWVLVSSAFPILARAARDDEERLGYALQRLFEMSLILGALIALGLAVGAPFAISVVAGHGFAESVPVLRLQALALVTSFLLSTWNFALLSLKLYSDILWANLLAAVVAIAGTLALAPPLGAKGAALATVGAEAVLAVTSLMLVRRARPALSPNLRVVPKVLLAGAVSVAVALAVPLPAVVLAILSCGAYGAVILALGALPPELFDALRGRSPLADDGR
jgi:O-antigen/teichoic acid export membrane protein